jgi:hypothetical protein
VVYGVGFTSLLVSGGVNIMTSLLVSGGVNIMTSLLVSGGVYIMTSLLGISFVHSLGIWRRIYCGISFGNLLLLFFSVSDAVYNVTFFGA